MTDQSKKVLERLQFSEHRFASEWSRRSIGMSLPNESMNGARCYSHWLSDPIIRELLLLIESQQAALTYYLRDDVSEEHYGSEIRKKVYSKREVKDALAHTDETLRRLGSGE